MLIRADTCRCCWWRNVQVGHRCESGLRLNCVVPSSIHSANFLLLFQTLCTILFSSPDSFCSFLCFIPSKEPQQQIQDTGHRTQDTGHRSPYVMSCHVMPRHVVLYRAEYGLILWSLSIPIHFCFVPFFGQGEGVYTAFAATITSPSAIIP